MNLAVSVHLLWICRLLLAIYCNLGLFNYCDFIPLCQLSKENNIIFRNTGRKGWGWSTLRHQRHLTSRAIHWRLTCRSGMGPQTNPRISHRVSSKPAWVYRQAMPSKYGMHWSVWGRHCPYIPTPVVRVWHRAFLVTWVRSFTSSLEPKA